METADRADFCQYTRRCCFLAWRVYMENSSTSRLLSSLVVEHFLPASFYSSFYRFFKIGFGIKQRADLLGFILMGMVLALHWVTFFHSIQISTVAIGLLTFATFPIFVTFLEPFFFGERIRLRDILVSIIVFFGLALVAPEFDLSNRLTLGVLWGTLAGFTFAILSVLNRKYVARYPALTITFYQNAVACLLLLPLVGGSAEALSAGQLGQLILLGVVFTALAHSLFVRGMRAIKAQLASIITCLEPVYGILLRPGLCSTKFPPCAKSSAAW